jgi:AbrB family looped-hinge helix DNA binding protein
MMPGEENGETFCVEVVSSGRITVPKIIRKKLGINEGMEVRVRIWIDHKDEEHKVATKERFMRK